MKYYIKSSVEFNTILLEGLAQDILEQVYEDNPYASLENVYYDVLDNCIFVINVMDEDGVYEDIKPFADYDNKNFCKVIKEFVDEKYNTLFE